MMKNRRFLLMLLITGILTWILLWAGTTTLSHISQTVPAEAVSVQSVSQDISATGSIHSENETTLHFPIAGKLVYLPFKEGDTVTAGQTVASLDERTVADTIENAVKTAQNQQISFDVVNEFNGNRDLSDTGLSVSARRQLQTAMNTLDQAKIALEIQRIAGEQAVLTAPFSGIITHEDVTTPFINVTTTTGFSLADPATKVFRAHVLASNIDFVSVGGAATIRLDGQEQPLSGIVEKIYPQKTTFPTGEDGYDVDIQASGLPATTIFGQTGSVLIKSNNQSQSLIVPLWAVVGHKKMWVLENNRPVLKAVSIGTAHGSVVEVTHGLSSEDKVILDPEKVVKSVYSFL